MYVRLLFVVVSLLTAGGMVGCIRDPGNAMPEERAAAIERLGGKVVRDTGQPDRPVVGVRIELVDDPNLCLAQVRNWTTLRRLQVDQNKATDSGLKNVKGLTGLQELMIYDTHVTDAGLENLKGLTNLRQLTIGHNGITDSGLANLSGLTGLEELYLFEKKVTDAGLEHIKGLNNLRRLVLAETGVTDAGLKELEQLTKLQDLVVAGTKVTEAGAKEFQKSHPMVRVTSTAGARALEEELVKSLPKDHPLRRAVAEQK